MNPRHIFGIPIIEEAAPSGFAAQHEQELYSHLQAAIDAPRCRACGSLNYETTLFVFSASVEKLIECRNCGDVHEEMIYSDSNELLGFLPGRIGSACDLTE